MPCLGAEDRNWTRKSPDASPMSEEEVIDLGGEVGRQGSRMDRGFAMRRKMTGRGWTLNRLGPGRRGTIAAWWP
jgi:hypothetical protein